MGATFPGALVEDWDALVHRAGAPPWTRPGWVDAWWQAFGKGDLRIIQVERDGAPVALAPFISRLGELRSASNDQTPTFELLAIDDEARSEFCSRLFEDRPRRLTLFGVPGSECMSCVSAATFWGYRATARVVARSPWIDLSQDLDTYMKSRPKKMMQELRRRERRLTEQGPLELEIHDGSEDLDRHLETCLSLEAKGWKGRHGTAIADRPQTLRFYDSMTRWAAAAGYLRLAILRSGGRAIAFDLSLEDMGVHYLLKTSFDPEVARWAPGMLLRRYMLERLFEQKDLHRYEFLGHAEEWKLRWTEATEERVLFRSFSPSLAGLADRVQFTWVRAHLRHLVERFA